MTKTQITEQKKTGTRTHVIIPNSKTWQSVSVVHRTTGKVSGQYVNADAARKELGIAKKIGGSYV